ncbi:MAG: hypothetical protein ACD_44C00326G0005 [uncultured bacterium]|nr:MAG: hypothetical protein ACD_44C00326G0005 [uncultured bacterium]OGT16633.1 MAG: hypothetical protein A3B69_03320 [Gammaproteobacteria bacterium RIFCSPHIGHO2_02_FULL_38_33]OGT23726.1 MAG: hypothetical protein A2W47_04740 [Gammaproteobacteria bacterium RIFCSPHIGHO2_12_38_15]OGT67810.1 MAG: hypothetical protein A3I12_01820 [Gammaproteobacteria bacterium RIFCSPLOWO2_02_FULL_38_11]OGT75786.1 MAG: hypothetical protein A3G71_06940 [Gammaproteobacteria bacterium RIFCSPLOWO2_12_FULL_38_14]
MIKMMFRILILLLFFGFITPVFASYWSSARIANSSPYIFKSLPGGWHITEGNKLFEYSGAIDVGFSADIWGREVLRVGFSNNSLSEAEAVYEYFDDNSVKQGECYFQFHTRDYVWEPSFRESRCTGPVSLMTEHRGGGGKQDVYIYVLY